MSLNINIDALPVPIQELPEITSLSANDVLVVNKNGSFTGRITVSQLTQYLLNYINSASYAADNVTIGLSASNTFYVLDNSITLQQLSPNVRDIITGAAENTGQAGSALTGTLTSFAAPLSATGDFIIVNINDTYKALRIWNFA